MFYIRAFSDRPQAMVSGFCKTERLMKCLFIKIASLAEVSGLCVAGIGEGSAGGCGCEGSDE